MFQVNLEDLKNFLVGSNILNESQFDQARELADREKISIEEILIGKGYMTDVQLGQVIAESQGFKFVSLVGQAISQDVINIIPKVVAKNQLIIAFQVEDNNLHVAMNNPRDIEMINWLGKKTGQNILVYYATKTDIINALKFYQSSVGEEFDKFIKEEIEKLAGREFKPEDAPIAKIVNMIIDYAHENRASDIHIEPHDEKDIVRFRIDGVMHQVAEIPQSFHDLIISRIKVMARLRIDEHQKAQDGHFEFQFNSSKFDVRVSVVPIISGEKIVMRLLSEKARRFSLEDLGMMGGDLDVVKKEIQKPYGMILSCGPSGCGKTTTMYAIMKILNTQDVNIMTIEDPVEYDIEGVNQIQVNPKANLTFAESLKAIIRQDPDIIMVGEIRDDETAGIAINAALTGHLVLSTLHTNDAPSAVVRLLDMGIEPFLVATSVNMVIAQRLVRKICPDCKASNAISEDALKIIKDEFGDQAINNFNVGTLIYKGNGCLVCSHTGYVGRTAIFEVMEVKDNIKDLIMKKANSSIIQRAAIENGMTMMLQDGIQKVLNGTTTIEELLRALRIK